MASQSLKDQNLEGLFNCPWFFGELSRENATEILNEAVKNDGESWYKSILFLETVSDDIQQNRFVIIAVTRRKGPNDIQPIITFLEIFCLSRWNWIVERNWNLEWNWNVVRKNPFSLEVLAMVQAARCGFNLETLRLPRMIEEEVKKFQDLNETIKSFE